MVSLALALLMGRNSTARAASFDLDAIRNRLIHGVESPASRIRLSGRSLRHGVLGNLTFDFDLDGRYVFQITGVQGIRFGFDGGQTWEADSASAWHRLSFASARGREAIALLLTDEWASRRHAKNLSERDGNVYVALGDGYQMSIGIDPQTSLPKSASWNDGVESSEITLSDWRSVGFRLLPFHLEIAHGPQVEILSVSKGQRLNSGLTGSVAKRTFEPPVWKDADTEFRAEASPIVESRLAANGQILIHAFEAGKELGWFILDSTTDETVVDPSIVATLGGVRVGDDGGPLYRIPYLTIGPMTMRDLDVRTNEFHALSGYLQLPVVGSLGFDFLRRATLSLELNPVRVGIFRPGGLASMPGDRWLPIRFEGRSAAISLLVDGQRGWFRIDTGDAASLRIRPDFLQPIDNAQDQRRSDGRSVIEVGGWRQEVSDVFLMSPEGPSSGDPFLAGSVGLGLISRFRAIFDYGAERCCLREGLAKP